jgi:hypothetical protein
MGFPFDQALPVLRTPAIARQDPTTFHIEIPGDRVAATPWAAFTTGQGLLTRADVTSSGVSGQKLFEKALENLVARAPTWKVEATTGGFLGIGKKPALITCTDPFAAEQILNEAFMAEARHLISPKHWNGSLVAFFAPKRGQVRAVLVHGKDTAETPFYIQELESAKATWQSAGAEAVCPAELGSSGTVGNTFAVRGRLDGKDEPYVPPLESVRVMVMHKKVLSYVTNGSTAPRREFLGDLSLCLGVRDENGQQTPLDEATLSQLELPFEKSLDGMIATIPILPIVDMGKLRTGQPVLGFRGNGAIDQLASARSLERLHATLGDPYILHAYSHVRVAATTADVPRTSSTLFELIELCDPRRPHVIMTRGTPDYEVYTVTGGRISGVSAIKG